MERQERRCRRLVLVPCPFQGHINPMLQLGNILHSKGFSITVAHPQFNSPDASKHPDFTFLPLLDGSSKFKPSDDFLAFMFNLNLSLRAPLQGILTRIIEEQEQHDQLPCIIYDGLIYSAEEVASDLKLPSIHLRTGSTTNFLTFLAYPQLREKGYIPLQGPMHKMGPASSSSLLEEDTSCISWLDKQIHNSVLYVSLGSTVILDQKEIEEMAWGLAKSKQPFLWVIRPGSVRGSESIDCLPEGFKLSVGERGCIVKWAPQKQVLAHSAVGGFWTHCGWNSTIESISEGVPMICRPSIADQRINTRYVSHVWKVGIELENDLERGEIERAIKSLMVGKEGEQIRQGALDLKVKSELCAQKGGSSYNNLNELVELIMSS